MVRGADLSHGFRTLALGTVTSTNDIARQFADQGEPAGLFVLAERQTIGRGRQGRTWQSPPGNFYASLLLRPTRPLAEAASLSLVAGLALAETIARLADYGLSPQLKWPNDVQLGGAKVAGVLLESNVDDCGNCSWLIVGMGVNLVSAPTSGVAYPTTHLAACGLEGVTPQGLLRALAESFAPILASWEMGGFAVLREAWLQRATGLGRMIDLNVGGRLVRGRLRDVDATGALLVEQAPGAFERFTAGEVVLR